MNPLFLVWLRAYHRRRHLGRYLDAIGGHVAEPEPRPASPNEWPATLDEFIADVNIQASAGTVIHVDFAAGTAMRPLPPTG